MSESVDVGDAASINEDLVKNERSYEKTPTDGEEVTADVSEDVLSPVLNTSKYLKDCSEDMHEASKNDSPVPLPNTSKSLNVSSEGMNVHMFHIDDCSYLCWCKFIDQLIPYVVFQM